MSDVVVTHVRTGTWLIEDIGIDVPHGVIVTIPADKALQSKDLWRAISQRILFRFHPGPIHKEAPAPSAPVAAPAPLPKLPDATPYLAPEQIARALSEHGDFLREALDMRDSSLHAVLLSQQETIKSLQDSLRDIMTAVQERTVAAARGHESAAGPARSPDQVSTEVPMFIPSTIKPKDVDEAHVNVQTDAQEGSGVAGASSALRKMKQSGNQ